MPLIYFDSWDLQYKSPFGAIRTGEPCELRLRLPKSGEYRNPRLLLFQADAWDKPQVIPLTFLCAGLGSNLYGCTLTVVSPQLCFYTFAATQDGKEKRLNREPDNTGRFVDATQQIWQLTVYDAQFSTPDFLKGGVFYQIFPDRFCRSKNRLANIPADRRLHEHWEEMPDYLPDAQGRITNSDYFGGNLRGILSKLDYLQRLGVTCIYLNPIFEAHSNHRYNTADYRTVDPLLGTNEDLRLLCEQAGRLGISVILDGVFSHTGDDSIYFNRQGRYPGLGACQSQQSPYYSWYDFIEWPYRYNCWWGFDTLPNVRETNPDYIDFICGEGGVLHHWLSLGVAGFRLDVADELPDPFLDALTASVKRYNPQALVLGEVWEDASNKVAYGVRKRYFLGAQLDSVMNYPFKDAILTFLRYGNGWELNHTILTILENYPKPVIDVLMNCLSTHDVVRAITQLSGEPFQGQDRQWQRDHHFLSDAAYQQGSSLFRLAEVLQFFLPGVPSIYYGDEIGMTGYRDPFNRCTYPWGKGDSSLLEFTCSLSALRGKYRSLLSGAPYLPVCCGKDLFAFARYQDGQGLLIAVNRGAAGQPLDLPFAVQPLLGSFETGVLASQAFLIAAIKE